MKKYPHPLLDYLDIGYEFQDSRNFIDREAGEIMRLAASVCLSIHICKTYTVHYFSGTEV